MLNRLFLLLIILSLSVSGYALDLQPPTHLTCEYLTNPLGVGETSPRLAWWVNDSRAGAKQTAYQILVSTDLNLLDIEKADAWDSGKVDSDQSIQIVYQGKPLVSNTIYFWKVRTWDAEGKPSAYSETAYWQMGFLNASDWKAKWIGLKNPANGAEPGPALVLRKEFNLPAPVKQATLHATALGVYELRINGQRVGDNILAPEWTDYSQRIQVQTYDVTDLLQQNGNAVGAQVGAGWYAGLIGLMSMNMYGKDLGLLLQLEIKCTDGSRLTWMTDESWQATYEGPIRKADNIIGEMIDARMEMPGWDQPGFDAKRWKPVELLTPPVAQLVYQPNEPICVTQTLTAVKRTEPAPKVFIYDLGQNMVGWCRVKGKGAAGTVVTLRHGEVLDEKGNLYTANLRGNFQKDSWILAGTGEEVFEPHFTYHGFRYVEITGLDEPPALEAVTGRVFHSAAPVAGTLECSSPLLNQLIKNIVWTQRGNMHSTPTDCPQRDERLGWMGDAQIFSQAACFNLNMAAFFTKWSQDIRDAQSQHGVYSDFSPNPRWKQGQFLGSPAWADAGMIVPWRVYENYGDVRLLERHYESAKKWVEYVHSVSPDNIWSQSLGNNYGDWLNGDTLILKDWPTKGGEIDKVQLATAFFYNSTTLLSKMAVVLSRKDDAEKYTQLAQNIKKAFVQKYITDDGRIQGDTQSGYALALHFNLMPDELREKAVAHLLRRLNDYQGRLSTGIQATNRLMLEFNRLRRSDLAYQVLNSREIPSWLYMVDHGATTVWERWDGWVEGRGFQNAGMNSFNHYAIGAVGEWMYRTIGGINPDPEIPAYKHFIIRPIPGGGLTYAKATYDSIQGKISTEWRLENGQFSLLLTIPANTSAAVYIPFGEADKIYLGDQLAHKVEGIQLGIVEKAAVMFQVPAGTYSFSYPQSNSGIKHFGSQ